MYAEFEQKLRQEICNAARELDKSDLAFAVFKETRCNAEYWNRTDNGGWSLKKEADAANAVNDIFKNGRKYATECATAMEIVYYKAVLEVYGKELFNETFTSIYLMDWDMRDPLLMRIGQMNEVPALIPGDRGYFANPDYSPDSPQWQGENVIVLEDGGYYGHGIGIADADYIISSLNSRRKQGSTQSAHLLKKAGRPDFKRLAAVMYSPKTVTVWRAFPPAVSAVRIEAGRETFC